MFDLIRDRIEPYPKIDKKESLSESEIIQEIENEGIISLG